MTSYVKNQAFVIEIRCPVMTLLKKSVTSCDIYYLHLYVIPIQSYANREKLSKLTYAKSLNGEN